MLVFDEALKYMIGGQDDPVRMDAEATASDFEGVFLLGIGPPFYDGNRSFLYRI
jgi:hypothetical protein